MSSVQALRRPRKGGRSLSARPEKENLVIEQAAKAALRETKIPPLERITCRCDGGLLVLRGQLPSFYMRQTAFVAVSKVAGVVVIDDQLEVT